MTIKHEGGNAGAKPPRPRDAAPHPADGRGEADVHGSRGASLRPLWERVAVRAELPAGIRLYDASRHAFGTAAADLVSGWLRAALDCKPEPSARVLSMRV